MAKIWSAVSLTALALALNGCGGSSSAGSPVNPSGGTTAPDYTANLPDGSPMDIEVVDEGGGDISGTFAVAATTGPYAFEAGSFNGSVSAGAVTMDCVNGDGTQFQMTGKQGSNGFELTRSDIPGTVLVFTIEQPEPRHRANQVTTYSTKATLGPHGTTGTLSVTNQRYSYRNSLSEYRGTFAGVPVTFWQFDNGQANIVISIDPLTSESATFSKLYLADLPKTTVNTEAFLNTYSSTTKSIFLTQHTFYLAP